MPPFPHILRLLLAGILSLPALVVLALTAPLVVILALPSICVLVRRKYFFWSPSLPKLQSSLSNSNNHPLLQHAIITGGSSGIGLAIACQLAKRYSCKNITLLARKESGLIEAKAAVEQASGGSTVVRIVSVDVTDCVALEKVAAKLCGEQKNTTAAATKSDQETDNSTGNETTPLNNNKKHLFDKQQSFDKQQQQQEQQPSPPSPPGPPTLLFNCAGYAIPLSFSDLTSLNFQSQVNVNYLGSVNVVKAFLPYMLTGKSSPPQNNKDQQQTTTITTQNHHQSSQTSYQQGYGNIVLTSSMSGQIGTYGYSAYSPTKFALRGFAESLSMELAAMGANSNGNVNISLAYPPDTNTPGYEVENLKKPEACRLISESGGIWDAEVVGKKIVKEALKSNPPFDIYFGIDGWMLSVVGAGMSPVTSVIDAICQVSMMGLLRFVNLFYLMDFGRVTQQCHATSDEVVKDGVALNGGVAAKED